MGRMPNSHTLNETSRRPIQWKSNFVGGGMREENNSEREKEERKMTKIKQMKKESGKKNKKIRYAY